jgi:prohead core protein protease|nr:MAG TPA: Prohead core protein serine protease [Caudoviricetes sp.]
MSYSYLIENAPDARVTESLEGKQEKAYYIEGIFAQADVLNGNRRIYPRKVLTEAIKPLNEMIAHSRLLGELEHPKVNASDINPDRSCIKILSLHEDGNNIMGKAKVMKSLPCGAIVYGLLSEGVTVGVSTRGFGETELREGKTYVKDLVLKTVDVVMNPSAPDAFMTAIMESKEWVFENGVLIEREKEMKKMINEEAGKKSKADYTRIFRQIIELATKAK